MWWKCHIHAAWLSAALMHTNKWQMIHNAERVVPVGERHHQFTTTHLQDGSFRFLFPIEGIYCVRVFCCIVDACDYFWSPVPHETFSEEWYAAYWFIYLVPCLLQSTVASFYAVFLVWRDCGRSALWIVTERSNHLVMPLSDGTFRRITFAKNMTRTFISVCPFMLLFRTTRSVIGPLGVGQELSCAVRLIASSFTSQNSNQRNGHSKKEKPFSQVQSLRLALGVLANWLLRLLQCVLLASTPDWTMSCELQHGPQPGEASNEISQDTVA